MLKKFLKSFKSGEKGFTLIELLVVISILGVLAAVAVPNVASFMSAGNVAAIKSNAAAIQTAADAFAAAGDGTYTAITQTDIETYMRTLPTIETYTLTKATGKVTITNTTGGDGTITIS